MVFELLKETRNSQIWAGKYKLVLKTVAVPEGKEISQLMRSQLGASCWPNLGQPEHNSKNLVMIIIITHGINEFISHGDTSHNEAGSPLETAF